MVEETRKLDRWINGAGNEQERILMFFLGRSNYFLLSSRKDCNLDNLIVLERGCIDLNGLEAETVEGPLKKNINSGKLGASPEELYPQIIQECPDNANVISVDTKNSVLADWSRFGGAQYEVPITYLHASEANLISFIEKSIASRVK